MPEPEVTEPTVADELEPEFDVVLAVVPLLVVVPVVVPVVVVVLLAVVLAPAWVVSPK